MYIGRWLRVVGFLLCAAAGIAWNGVVSCQPEMGGEDSSVKEQSGGESPVVADSSTTKDEPAGIDPKSVGYNAICPGGQGCLSNKGELKVGAAAVKITPQAYEVARWVYFDRRGFCPPPTPRSAFGAFHCGTLNAQASGSRRDCGRDGLCPRDKWTTDIECDENKACPSNPNITCNTQAKRCVVAYTQPDEDGSEKDGLPDFFLDCGRDRVCPCLDAQGKPSYYGKDKTCLAGDKPNPDYKGPDADGSEGDGEFQAMWMGGFGGNQPMQGVHDDTWARALIFETGETTVAIVSIDVVGYFFDEVQKIRKRVQELLSEGAVDYILVSSTHTHEGPDTMGQWGPRQSGVPYQTGFDPEYRKVLVEQIAQSVKQAYEKRQVAKLKVGRVQTGLKGLALDTRVPVVFDDTLLALHATNEKGETIATLVNWGNHPEVLANRNNYLSSDFCHYTREALEQGATAQDPSSAVQAKGGISIYLQGSIGGLIAPWGLEIKDLDGTVHKKDDWDRARALGQQVALRTQQALDKGQDITDTAVSIWAKAVKLTVENRVFHLAFSGGLLDRTITDYNDSLPFTEGNFPKVPTEVALIKVGPLTFYSMPGELDPQVLVGGYDGSYSHGYEIIRDDKYPGLREKMKKDAPKGPYLKERVPGTYKFFVGLGNDQLGYLLARWNFVLDEKNPYFSDAKGDHYEETNSLGPDTVPDLLKAYDELLTRVRQGTPSP
ncbi:MAG: hypothetical protein EP343_17175 [Deltaproteobacteria bacterium]|nr:MAG: hypothetical protein EP343_17175 [Deltaproteobacteria bacterium]